MFFFFFVGTCSPLKVENTKLECFFGNNSVDCDGLLKAGTRALAKCRENYQSSKNESSLNETRCKSDGEWSSALMKCEPSKLRKIISEDRKKKF